MYVASTEQESDEDEDYEDNQALFLGLIAKKAGKVALHVAIAEAEGTAGDV